eukprot:49430-Alexandrium_andersonii.AAC.1
MSGCRPRRAQIHPLLRFPRSGCRQADFTQTLACGSDQTAHAGVLRHASIREEAPRDAEKRPEPPPIALRQRG